MSAALTIRPARDGDRPTLEVLGPDTFREAFGDELPAAAVAARMAQVYARDRLARDLADPAQAWLLACVDQVPVGFLVLNQAAEPPPCVRGPRPAELARLYVQAGWHGRGPGRALLEAGLAEAAARGVGTLWLQAWARNGRALSFYRRHGFRRRGQVEVTFAGHHLPHLVLVRRLG